MELSGLHQAESCIIYHIEGVAFYRKLALSMGLDRIFNIFCLQNDSELVIIAGLLRMEVQGMAWFVMLLCNRRILRLLREKPNQLVPYLE